jgi:hypothetical protein
MLNASVNLKPKRQSSKKKVASVVVSSQKHPEHANSLSESNGLSQGQQKEHVPSICETLVEKADSPQRHNRFPLMTLEHNFPGPEYLMNVI